MEVKTEETEIVEDRRRVFAPNQLLFVDQSTGQEFESQHLATKEQLQNDNFISRDF